MGAHKRNEYQIQIWGLRWEAKPGASRINSSSHKGEEWGKLKHEHRFPEEES